MLFTRWLLVVAALWMAAGSLPRLEAATINVDLDKPGHAVSPLLYGIFFEEINRAGDGGIYAELVQNRSFEDAAVPVGWELVKSKAADVEMVLDKSQPLNANNLTSLRLDIKKASGRAGVANIGFRGCPIRLNVETGKVAA